MKFTAISLLATTQAVSATFYWWPSPTPPSHPTPTPPSPSPPSGCYEVEIDFDEFHAGDTPSDLGFGITLSGETKVGHYPPMIFDTAHPTGHDYDLATHDLREVLILSEDGDAHDPDDALFGGEINFSFDPPIYKVKSLDFLDVQVTSYIEGTKANHQSIGHYTVPGTHSHHAYYYYGHGNRWTSTIDQRDVKDLTFDLRGPGAISKLTVVYCPPDTPAPTPVPTPIPTPRPTPADNGDCSPLTIDFEQFNPGNSPRNLGDGIIVVGRTRDGNFKPMILDTTVDNGADTDLVDPHSPFGNVLILSADGNSDVPDDSEVGGNIRFLFDPPVEVISVGLLDFDETGSLVFGKFGDGSGIPRMRVPPSRSGAAQTFDVDLTDVSELKVSLKGSGAIIQVDICV